MSSSTSCSRRVSRSSPVPLGVACAIPPDGVDGETALAVAGGGPDGVAAASTDVPDAAPGAEPTRASRRVATFDQAMDNSTDIWWKVLEIRKGWVKIRTIHLGITGWIESRILCGSKGVDC